MSRSARAGQVLLVLLGLLCCVVASSVYAPVEEPFESDAQGLIATFGVGFGLFVVLLAVAGLNARQRWAWRHREPSTARRPRLGPRDAGGHPRHT